MPFQKSFNILLEDVDTAENSNFLLLDRTADGVDVGDKLIGVDASASEAKPSGLTENANGDADYDKRNVLATESGWVFKPGTPNSGNDNKGAQPEVLVCVRGLASSIDVPTSPQISIGNTSDKTKYYPDGDTFTGVASSTLGDITVYCYFNEPVHVTGTPQLQLKQATALGSTFGTIMDINTSVSVFSEGIVAFSLPASTDTRTSNVTNNTLGIKADDEISLNSGTVQKLNNERIILESGVANDQVYLKLDGTDSSSRDNNGFVTHEGGIGLPADLALSIDSNATMTVS
tara:strand:+ start:25 stop:891 length:867 start_codon:yes stop_codon:yes gene_type:complete